MGRRLGQHVLTDPAILDRIADAIDPHPTDVVLEIGAGTGTLTRRLAPRVGRVIAVERDPRLIRALGAEDATRRQAGRLPPNVALVSGDALRLDWGQLVRQGPAAESGAPGPAFKVVGNIPYYITTPLIEKSLTPPMAELVVFLVQLEVADRLTAPPGGKAYGALTVGVQVVARIERLFPVRAGAFRPPPAVDSAAVRLTPLAVPLLPAESRPAFRRFVAALFSQRRKQLVRSLRSVAGMDRETAAQVLGALGIDPEARPEVLAPQALVRLFHGLRR